MKSIKYLEQTPVSFLCREYNKYNWLVFDLEIPSELSELKTWWGRLKDIPKNPANPNEKFELAEVAEMVRSGKLPDQEIQKAYNSICPVFSLGPAGNQINIISDGPPRSVNC